MTHASRAFQRHDLSGGGISCGSHTYFFTIQRHGGPPQMSDHLNAGVTSETTQHSLTHSFEQDEYEKEDYEDQMIFGIPWGPKASRHLSYR